MIHVRHTPSTFVVVQRGPVSLVQSNHSDGNVGTGQMDRM